MEIKSKICARRYANDRQRSKYSWRSRVMRDIIYFLIDSRRYISFDIRDSVCRAYYQRRPYFDLPFGKYVPNDLPRLDLPAGAIGTRS